MPLFVSVTKKLKGAKKNAPGDIYLAEGKLEIDNQDMGSAQVLVQDQGEGSCSLVVNNEVEKNVLLGKEVKQYTGNTNAEYADKLGAEVELTFSKFSFK